MSELITDTLEANHEEAEQADNVATSNIAPIQLTALELRVLGTLMEKQLTTPDSYPLTENSLLIGCNQKTSREPISQYQLGEIARSLRELETRKLIKYEMGARSSRYEQRLTHELSISKNQQALLCVIMLRGPQTFSELQARTQRMINNSEDLQLSLERLTQGETPLAMVLNQPGQRGTRYAHLFCGKPALAAFEQPHHHVSSNSQSASKIDDLEAKIEILHRELNALYELTGFKKPSAELTSEPMADPKTLEPSPTASNENQA